MCWVIVKGPVYCRTTKAPNQAEYLTFSDEVKDLASQKYDFTFNPNEPISIFVAAFYDAVLLYAHALRDYIEVSSCGFKGH